ncbi:MAG TPA: NAD(P)/FAD-dependent oxidoreductase [Jiangellaceae bacterium]|nr:NAD(P)/FAD-dependent oxidoreductase [Jiangellaceae bacterium]
MRERFDAPEADQIWAPWLLHSGLSPDSASGGMMIPVLAMSLHGFGAPIVAGGASNFVRAFERLFDELDVTVMTGCLAESIRVANGRATEVNTDGGALQVSRAVIASVTPQALYGTLLKGVQVPAQTRAEAARYRFRRAAMQIHVALDRPLVWSDERLQDVPILHVSNGSASTGIACAQADAGMLPAAPTVVVGRQHLLDSTRVPEGAGSLWLQLQELPWQPRHDAGGTIPVDGNWSKSTTAAYVDRVLDRIEEFAPGMQASILEVDALNPVDLADANPNAVHGDPYGGSAELDQNLLWRPLPHSGKHATSIRGLWQIGASTHPGPGLNGGSGHLVAQSLLRAKA